MLILLIPTYVCMYMRTYTGVYLPTVLTYVHIYGLYNVFPPYGYYIIFTRNHQSGFMDTVLLILSMHCMGILCNCNWVITGSV